MTQEEKQLLLKDLWVRAMYRPFVQLNPGAYNEPEICRLTGVDWPDRVYISTDSDYYSIETIKPYLRSLSSMTEEEAKEVCRLENFENRIMIVSPNNHTYHFTVGDAVIDWLHKNHFDYRGLIEKGLALEALEWMYESKIK